MSTELYWRPTPPENDSESLPYALKKLLAPRLWGRDGSCKEEVHTLQRDSWALAYIQGLADAGVEGAEELHAALVKHRVIDVWIAD